MKTLNYFFIITSIILAIIFSCSEDVVNTGLDDNDTITSGNYTVTQVKSFISQSSKEFAFDIFKAIESNQENSDNIFISPLSMYYALAMAANGADGQTREEFNELLGINNIDDGALHNAIQQLYNEVIPLNNDITVEVANSIWPKTGFPIKQNYIDEIQDYFMADVKPMDFTAPYAVDSINNWIEEKTHDKIQDMLDYISQDAVLYLINAVYFYGNWKYQFADTSNYEDYFYKENGSSGLVTFMKQKASFKYASNQTLSAIKIPYVDSNYYMMILLPQNQKNTDDILNELNSDYWNYLNDTMINEEITLHMPKFRFSFGTRQINEELISLGLEKPFLPGADFSAIADAPIILNRVLHKAFIEVNEEGSEAAAATIIEIIAICENCGSRIFHLIINRPFIFVIGQEETNNILFIGKVAWPNQNL